MIPVFEVKQRLDRSPLIQQDHQQWNLVTEYKRQRGGYAFIRIFVDEYSRYIMAFRTNSTGKKESLDQLRTVDLALFNKYGKHIGTLRLDNGSEYDNDLYRTYGSKNGITLEFCLPYKHGGNGISERTMRTMVEGGMAALQQSSLPYDFLFDACLHFVFTRNNTPGIARSDKRELGQSPEIKTPFELFHGQRSPAIKFLPFGILVRPTIPPPLRTKHMLRTEEGILVGYSLDTKGGYLVYRPDKKTIVTRDDINPDIHTFPALPGGNDNHNDED